MNGNLSHIKSTLLSQALPIMNIDSHLSPRLKVYNQGFPKRFSKIMLVGEFKDWKGALHDIVRVDNLS